MLPGKQIGKFKVRRLVLISLALVFAIFTSTESASSQELIPDWKSNNHAPFILVEAPYITNPVITASNVTDVSASFVADPFLFYENDQWYMFFEVFNKISGRGEIGLATSSDGLHWNYDQIILSEEIHLSYPFVFKHNDEYYLIPETKMANEVRLYRATAFPYNWTYVSTLLTGRGFVDPSLFYYNNMWWMFVGGLYHSTCYLFYSDSLTTGWTEHPMSPIVSNDKSKARPGGRSFVFDNDRVMRIAQKDDVVYGEQVRVFEVDILTRTDYVEREIPESPILTQSGIGWNATGMHHFDPWWNGNHWLCAVDGNRNGVWSIGLYIAYPFENLVYTPVNPCRIVDTRKAGGAIPPSGIRNYNVHGDVASQGGNPAGCPSPKGEPLAVALNVTAVPVSGLGYLTAYPYCSNAPLASLVNYKAGIQPIANSGTVKTCFNCTKDISVKSGSGTSHVVIDVLGYYYAKP
jgi:hypothetical protein